MRDYSRFIFPVLSPPRRASLPSFSEFIDLDWLRAVYDTTYLLLVPHTAALLHEEPMLATPAGGEASI